MANKEVELDDIFTQNEVQVRAMLEQAVKSKKTIDEQYAEAGLETERCDMNEKQRVFCLRFIQSFFADLGNPLVMPLKQELLAGRDKVKKYMV